MNPQNIYAPPAYGSLPSNPGKLSVDIPYDYIYDVVLTGNQALRDQIVAIQNDADFVLRSIKLASYTGAFQIRLSDSQGTYLSNGYLNYGVFLSGGVAVEFPMFPELTFPAGGRIGIDITDTSGATNTIEIAFRGAKRYRVPAEIAR